MVSLDVFLIVPERWECTEQSHNSLYAKILDSQICNLTSTHNEEVMVLDASSIAHKLQLIGLVRYYLRGNLQGSLSFIVGTT